MGQWVVSGEGLSSYNYKKLNSANNQQAWTRILYLGWDHCSRWPLDFSFVMLVIHWNNSCFRYLIQQFLLQTAAPEYNLERYLFLHPPILHNRLLIVFQALLKCFRNMTSFNTLNSQGGWYYYYTHLIDDEGAVQGALTLNNKVLGPTRNSNSLDHYPTFY